MYSESTRNYIRIKGNSQLLGMWKFLVFVIFYIALVSARCTNRCLCPPEPLTCAAGVSVVVDEYESCKVCARQLNEDCSKMNPCDRVKGLECNYGGQYGAAKGICRARLDGRTCEYNKKIYQNGETFKPNCKHQCTCLDGEVGCVSLCPRELTLPKEGCPKPRLVKVPGRCCEQLICPDQTERSMKKFRKKQRLTEDYLNGQNMATATAWRDTLPAFRADAVESTMVVSCDPETTAWSPCSKSCGTGVSTRMTISSDTQCKKVTETRLCEVRPCHQIKIPKLTNGQKCRQMETSSRPVRVSFEGCRSVKRLQVKYCGSCADGRCCRPQRTHTVPVLFSCINRESVKRMVMVIQSCKCDFDCSDNHKRAPHKSSMTFTNKDIKQE